MLVHVQLQQQSDWALQCHRNLNYRQIFQRRNKPDSGNIICKAGAPEPSNEGNQFSYMHPVDLTTAYYIPQSNTHCCIATFVLVCDACGVCQRIVYDGCGWGPGLGSRAAWFGAVPWSSTVFNDGESLTTPPHFLTLLNSSFKIFNNLFIQWGVGGWQRIFIYVIPNVSHTLDCILCQPCKVKQGTEFGSSPVQSSPFQSSPLHSSPVYKTSSRKSISQKCKNM